MSVPFISIRHIDVKKAAEALLMLACSLLMSLIPLTMDYIQMRISVKFTSVLSSSPRYYWLVPSLPDIFWLSRQMLDFL